MDSILVFRSWQQARLSLAVSIFCGFMAVDTYKAFKKKAFWIQPGALVLSAFSLQLLGFLDNSHVNITDYPNIQEYDLKNLAKMNLIVDGGRVIVCIYMGYLLPSMVSSQKNGIHLWGDIGALAISLGSHIFSELYVFKKFYWEKDELRMNPLSVAFRLCVVLCTMLLFLFLASAAFAGRTLYNMMFEKIPLALPEELAPLQVTTEEESTRVIRERINDIKGHVLQSWLVVWVSQPDYVIARSVLSSAVGVVIIICALFYGMEFTKEDYKSTHFDDGIDWLRYTTISFHCLLIVEGAFIIFWRWITNLYYFRRNWNACQHVEDFWRRHILDMIDSMEYRGRRSWGQQVSFGDFLSHLKLQICSILLFHKWLLPLFLWMQILTVWFSKLCFFVSQIIVVFLCKPCAHEETNIRYEDSMKKLILPGETPEMLWTATKKAFIETERFMTKGVKDAIPEEVIENGPEDGVCVVVSALLQTVRTGFERMLLMRCGKDALPSKLNLVELMANSSCNQRSANGSSNHWYAAQKFLDCLETTDGLDVEKDFMSLKNLSCKMTVLSLIRVMMELWAPWGSLSNLLDAYDEAYEFLDLLDYHDFTVFTNAAEKEFALLKRCVEERKEQPRQTIGELKGRTVINHTEHDSVDWWAAASNNSKYKICNAIYNDNQNEKQIMDTIDHDSMKNLLGGVMLIKIMEAGSKLTEYCKKWATEMEEEKIRAAVYVTGKLDGVIRAYENRTPTSADV